jgi:hypothetical protein
MFGTEGEESRGEGSWNVLIFSIFQPSFPPLSLHLPPSKHRVKHPLKIPKEISNCCTQLQSTKSKIIICISYIPTKEKDFFK